MKTFEEDFSDGIKSENLVFEIIKNKYENLLKSDKFCVYDFSNDKYEIELKTRNIAHDLYSTVIISCNKCERKRTKRIVLMFQYTDGLYYIRYRKSKFKHYEKFNFRRNQRNDFNDKYSECFKIPITDLKKFV